MLLPLLHEEVAMLRRYAFSFRFLFSHDFNFQVAALFRLWPGPIQALGRAGICFASSSDFSLANEENS